MLVIPFNSTPLSLSLLPVCLSVALPVFISQGSVASWYCVLWYHSSILPKPSEAPFPHPDICCPYRTLELDGYSLRSVFTSYCVCGTKVPRPRLAPEVPIARLLPNSRQRYPRPDCRCSLSLSASLFGSLQSLFCFTDYFLFIFYFLFSAYTQTLLQSLHYSSNSFS